MMANLFGLQFACRNECSMNNTTLSFTFMPLIPSDWANRAVPLITNIPAS